MMAETDRLPPIQRRALVALLATKTTRDAAEAVGISDRTMRRYLADPGFLAAYRTLARESAQQATIAVLAAQQEALEVLRDCMQTGSPATRVRAARAVLELGVKIAADDLAERLDQLEREVEGWARPAGLKLA